MKTKIQILIIISCCLLMCNSCSSWLDVKPYDQMDEENLMSNEEGFMKLLNGIYIELNDENLYGKTLLVEMLEMMGGAIKVDKNSRDFWGDYVDLVNYKYTTIYWRGRMDKIWNKTYALIVNCNKILDNLESRRDIFTGDHYNIIRGEALALRAMLHFDMLRLFGPVPNAFADKCIPYYTTQSVQIGELLSATRVLELVVADLKAAEEALKNDPVQTEGTLMSGKTNGTANFLRYRALRLNYYAVQGLLARVYLYAGDKSSAFTYADKVIKAAKSGVFPAVTQQAAAGATTGNPDRIFSSEVLFALTNVNRGLLFKNNYDPSRTDVPVFTMEDNLYKLIYNTPLEGGSADDYRCKYCWRTFAGSTSYFYKYADIDSSGLIRNTMIPMLRLGEMYLIAAESQSEDLNAGLPYVTELRNNRGIAGVTELTPDRLTYEYIRELYGEGQLFYYYKRRFTTILDKANANKVPSGTAASAEVFTVPLPDTEMNNRQ